MNNTFNLMEEKVLKLKELKARRDVLDTKIDALETQIKGIMTETNTYEFIGENWKVTWNTVSSNRFDSSKFRADHPDLYEGYKKLTESRRFSIS